VTQARLVPVVPQALRLCKECIDTMAHHVLELEKVAQQANTFDVIHFHIDYLHFPLSRCRAYTHVTTLHGRLDLPDLVPLYEEFSEMPVVSISNAQRTPISTANWQETVYHGLPGDLYQFHSGPGKYLAFLGRISPEKRVDRAIEIARRAGLPLKIAAKVDKADQEYFEREIKSLLAQPHVEFIGEVNEEQKNDFLGNAIALLFPIDWCEPFGLVMIEAMACGTPVIAFRRGSVEEVMVPGRSGFICDTVEEAVEAMDQIKQLDRAQCRRVFEERYTVSRMARDYAEIYRRLSASRNGHARNHQHQRAVFDSGRVASA